MKKQEQTSRLILNIEPKESAEQVLSFYLANKRDFEKVEPTRPINFYTIAYHRLTLSMEETEILNRKHLRYHIYLKEQPEEIIGTVCFSNIRKAPFYSATLGYKIDKRYRRLGIATEAISFCLNKMKSEYGLHRIECRVLPDNTASIALLRSLGFFEEGIEREGVEIDGTLRDHLRFAKLLD